MAEILKKYLQNRLYYAQIVTRDYDEDLKVLFSNKHLCVVFCIFSLKPRSKLLSHYLYLLPILGFFNNE